MFCRICFLTSETSPSEETGMTMVSGLSEDCPKEGRERRRMRDSVRRRGFVGMEDYWE